MHLLLAELLLHLLPLLVTLHAHLLFLLAHLHLLLPELLLHLLHLLVVLHAHLLHLLGALLHVGLGLCADRHGGGSQQQCAQAARAGGDGGRHCGSPLYEQVSFLQDHGW
ncbi:hypothetical protein AA16373_1921 [Komagataeibacter swingsii DSM 16373]|nr:hypothetical protein AA16373_1921 [Komagataeibacter swingsii DSM 16373]